MSDDFVTENYTFTRDMFINNELESSITYDFNNKVHITEVLQSFLFFLRASGYDYVNRIVAVKDSGEEVANDDDINDDIIEILNRVVEELEGSPPTKKKPKLEVVHINDNHSKPPDTD